MKDEWGNIICPKCKERKFKIVSVSSDTSGIIKFKALCLCKKKFVYERPVSEVGVYYKPNKPVKTIFPKKIEKRKKESGKEKKVKKKKAK